MNKQLIDLIRALAGQCQFCSITYKTKEERSKKTNEITKGGEVARYVILIGFNYHKCVEKSLTALHAMSVSDVVALCDKQVTLLPYMMEAFKEVEASLQKTLDAHAIGEQNADYTKKDMYISLGAGLNLNSNDNTLQLFGLINSKVVLKPGVYKEVNSAPMTLAKNLIKSNLPINKFREFALDLGNIQGVKLNGNTMEFEMNDDLSKQYGKIKIDLHYPKDNRPKTKLF